MREASSNSNTMGFGSITDAPANPKGAAGISFLLLLRALVFRFAELAPGSSGSFGCHRDPGFISNNHPRSLLRRAQETDGCHPSRFGGALCLPAAFVSR